MNVRINPCKLPTCSGSSGLGQKQADWRGEERMRLHYTQRIRDLREDHDLKQENVARALGITQQQYQLYESGKRKIPIDKFMLLCEYYNVSADYLLCYTDEQHQLKKQ